MNTIAFIDTEIEPKTGKILDIGGVKEDGGNFHNTSIVKFGEFIKGTHYVCGHNILNHDLKYIGDAVKAAGVRAAIDTLFWSPLLFPTRPYHALVKDDKLQSYALNNPLNDSLKARDLFHAEVAAFHQIDEQFKEIFHSLLHDKREFRYLFSFIGYTGPTDDLENRIRKRFEGAVCENVNFSNLIVEYPIELAYSLAIIDSFVRHHKIYSITPPWVLKSYPHTERIIRLLRNKPCITGCGYCNSVFDAHAGLKRIFGYNSFKTFAGEPLQEKAVQAAIANKSIIAIFPTGGGKSITFQLPALLSGENSRGLTVVISPLQSLMKDQVDNLEKVYNIMEAVTINGLLDPIERAKSIERVEDGSASLLYISPELLRSNTIKKLLLGRRIDRFVIDEAHCLSSWGQDFRVDYLYIAPFIKDLQQTKSLTEGIPVSCFTATAKPKVIEDIQTYFKDQLSLDLEVFTSTATRTNLVYKVYEKNDDLEKYQTLRDLIESKACPTIVYVSRTRRADELAEKLTKDGFEAKAFHGKMNADEKIANQNAFVNGELPIMVATSAFGMGVDKKNIGMVIHYEISDSLENYVQEAGRAGRDKNLVAECYVLFNEDDLGKHFILLNQTKLSIKEIQQVWSAIKDLTKFRATMSNSALEIARKAGWDDNVREIETRVTTAIAALEDAGYLKRGQNMPRVFATGILAKTAQEAIDKIAVSTGIPADLKENAGRIITKLVSGKSKARATGDDGETRIDYISDHLGIKGKDVIQIINLLREEGILADTKDMSAFLKQGESQNRSMTILQRFIKVEQFLLKVLDQQERTYHLKELNEEAEAQGFSGITPSHIKTILNFWAIKHWIQRHNNEDSRNHFAAIAMQPREVLKTRLEKRHELAKFILEFLYANAKANPSGTKGKEELLVEFSIHSIKEGFEKKGSLFNTSVSLQDVEDTLFYLSRIEAVKIEGGFLVLYNRLTIERLEQDTRKKYKLDDYKKLDEFYEQRIQQIHIVGEYAKRMVQDYKDALQFVHDYFHLNYSSFLNKYFKGSREKEIKENLTPARFKQLFGELSPTQLKIIRDREKDKEKEKEKQYIVVAAGPGSGKTRVLVHKLASLLLMEDVKHEQLLMVTFSRAAATEFKKRLIQLIGNAALYVEINTFHSYCFDLVGKVGSLETSDDIINKAVELIRNHEVEASRITKAVLVIDEAQDMSEDEYKLINALIEHNEEMRVIAVGDDDQTIYEFRGASARYLEDFLRTRKATSYELTENYRSKNNLVYFTNQLAARISHRLKKTPIIATQRDNGKIRLIRYQNKNLILPLVADVRKAELRGTTCILTKTNDEALQVTGQLLKAGMPAKLIQTNDGFRLINLAEFKYLFSQLHLKEGVSVIADEHWEEATRTLASKFQKSTALELCNSILRRFVEVNPKRKYKSDLETFLRESKIEEFINAQGETVLVSTIHKAKGKEFDNVFLLLEDFIPSTDEAKRLLYVAMTRAKQNLTIHLNGSYLDQLTAENLTRVIDSGKYLLPNELLIQLTHRDINLGAFVSKQASITKLMSGDNLIPDENGCMNVTRENVLIFSKRFKEKIEELKNKGYELKRAKVNFVVYWYNDDLKKEFAIVLPELGFDKKQ